MDHGIVVPLTTRLSESVTFKIWITFVIKLGSLIYCHINLVSSLLSTYGITNCWNISHCSNNSQSHKWKEGWTPRCLSDAISIFGKKANIQTIRSTSAMIQASNLGLCLTHPTFWCGFLTFQIRMSQWLNFPVISNVASSRNMVFFRNPLFSFAPRGMLIADSYLWCPSSVMFVVCGAISLYSQKFMSL